MSKSALLLIDNTAAAKFGYLSVVNENASKELSEQAENFKKHQFAGQGCWYAR